MTGIEIFAELFRGNTSAHGVWHPDAEKREDGKAKGRAETVSLAPLAEHYAAHVAGTRSMGIIPIDANSNVRFVAIDVDVYPLDPKHYCMTIDKYKWPLTCFRSKSGGLHIICFFSADSPAAKALDYLNVFRHLLQIPSTAETFPKQRRLTEKQKGNWINLPYFGGDNTDRYAYGPDGAPLSFKDAMNWCYNRRTTLKGLEQHMESLPFAKAPPCIQSLFIHNEVSVTNRNRNIFLFNAAIYLKSRFGAEFPDRLALVNDELDKPLAADELEKTIIASHLKGSYTYQCEDPNLSSHCYKELCKLREYGKGSGTISNFSFERLIQVKSSPPYYKWLVNGVEMVFFSEADLYNQEKFIQYCIRYLHKVPNKLKQPVWVEILNNALSEVVVDEVSIEDDYSPTTLWMTYAKEFFTDRPLAIKPSQINMGQAYLEQGVYYFRIEDLHHFITETKRFKYFSIAETNHLLRRLGFASSKLWDKDTKKGIRCWKGAVDFLATTQEPPKLEMSAPLAQELIKEKNSHKERPDSIAALRSMIDDMAGEPLDFSSLTEEDKF